MARGDGTKPYQRADSYWVARFDAGYTASGTRRRKTVFGKTEAECKRRLREAVRAWRAAGETSINPKTTVKKWCDTWIDAREHSSRPAAHRTAKSMISTWIVPTVGHKRLSELTAGDLRLLDDALRTAGRSGTTLANTRRLLGTILTDARAEGHTVPESVFAAAKPAPAPSERQAMSIPEAIRLLIAATNPQAWPDLPPYSRAHTPEQRVKARSGNTAHIERYHASQTDPSRWLAALLQAMRQGESLGLLWDEVDFTRRLIVIRWELQAVPFGHAIPQHLRARHLTGRYWLLPPKTRAGERVLPMVPTMYDSLNAWRERCPDSPHGLVWPNPDGSPRSANLDRAAWRGLQAAAGINHPSGRPYLVHEARHTTATLLQAAGVSPEVIISIVGHASYASTQPYIHRDLSQARAALESVAALLTPSELAAG